jgi:hypothetical protein
LKGSNIKSSDPLCSVNIEGSRFSDIVEYGGIVYYDIVKIGESTPEIICPYNVFNSNFDHQKVNNSVVCRFNASSPFKFVSSIFIV